MNKEAHTTDKQNPQTVSENEFLEQYTGYPVSSFRHVVAPLQKEVAELRGERQRLRDAVNEKQTEVYEHTRYNHEAEAARIEGYELCEWFLSLLERGSGKEETTDKVKE